VLLAFGSAELARKVLAADLAQYTPHTITDADRLRDELDAIRAAGYAVNEQERFIGVRAVGVPVRNSRGQIVGAVSAAAPVQRADRDRLLAMKALLAEAAEEFAASLV
jgi:DNA-binding IclR family transcriptional regulator